MRMISCSPSISPTFNRTTSPARIVGGLGIVILAIVLDRITQGMGQSGRERRHRHWWQGGPIGVVLRLLSKPKQTATGNLKTEN